MKMPDVTWRLGGLFVVPGTGLAKVQLIMDYYRDNPAVVEMSSVTRGRIDTVWVLSRDVLWNAAFNRCKSGDGDFVVEPIEQAVDIPVMSWSLRNTLLCHMSTNNGVVGGKEYHEHLIMSVHAVQMFLQETAHVVPLEAEDYTPHIDRLLAEIFG